MSELSGSGSVSVVMGSGVGVGCMLLVPACLRDELMCLGFYDKTIDRILVVISLIMEAALYFSKNVYAPVEIHSDKFKALLGKRNYKPILDKLIEARIISRGSSYKVHERSKQVRVLFGSDKPLETCWLKPDDPILGDCGSPLNDLIQHDQHTMRVLEGCHLDIKLAEDLINRHGQRIVTDVDYDPKTVFDTDPPPDSFKGSIFVYDHSSTGYKQIRGENGWWNTVKTKAIASEHPGIWIKREKTYYYGPQECFQKYRRQTSIVSAVREINKFHKGQFSAYRDSTSGRLHSNFTRWPNFMTPALTYEGQALCEIDYSCFQYLLFANSVLGRLTTPVSEFFRDLKIHDSSIKFGRLCASGFLYNYLTLAMLLATGDDQDRDKIKQELMRCSFGSAVGHLADSEFKGIVRHLFPQVVECMDKYKLLFKGRSGHRGDAFDEPQWYSELSRELHRIEAGLMIDDLHIRLANIPHLTKHDAVYVPEGWLSKAMYVIHEFSTEHFGEGGYHLKIKKHDFKK